MHEYLLVFYLAIPAFLANVIPVIAKKLNWFSSLDKPLDFNLKFLGQRVFGPNKTWRGLISGTIVGALFGTVQYFLQTTGLIETNILVSFMQFLLYGSLAGFGALLGDSIESFFKRQFKIKSGRPFIPFDQIDYILGMLLFTFPLISWELNQIIFLLIAGLILNPLTNFFAYVFKIKNTYW